MDTSSQEQQTSEKTIRYSTDKPAGQSDDAKSIMITHKSMLWQQSSTTTPNASHTSSGSALLRDKGHLLNTELALTRTIRNYNSKRHHSQAKSQGFSTLGRLGHSNATYITSKQHQRDSGRPQSSVGHKKSSTSHKVPKVRPFSATVPNTDTAKDLELLTKSICRHVSINNNLQ